MLNIFTAERYRPRILEEKRVFLCLGCLCLCVGFGVVVVLWVLGWVMVFGLVWEDAKNVDRRLGKAGGVRTFM